MKPRRHEVFPKTSHDLFASFLSHRLASDAHRVEEKFGLPTDKLTDFAEELAFALNADPALGLSATLAEAAAALGKPEAEMSAKLQALVYVELLLVENPGSAADHTRYAFVYRRLQEYFATSVLLRDITRVDFKNLLLDARWRETAVALIQLGSPDEVAKLLRTARWLLGKRVGRRAAGAVTPYKWPSGVLHLLGILAAGAANPSEKVPAPLRALVGQVLLDAWRNGRRHDRVWTIEVVSVAPEEVATEILLDAFESPSPLIREVAYERIGDTHSPNPSIEAGIRRDLFAHWAAGGLAQRAWVFKARFRVLHDARDAIWTYRLLRVLLPLDVLLVTAGSYLVAGRHTLGIAILALVTHGLLHLRRIGLALTVTPRQRADHLVAWVVTPRREMLAFRAVGRVGRLLAAAVGAWLVLRHGLDLPGVLVAVAVVIGRAGVAVAGVSVRLGERPGTPDAHQ